MGNQVNIHVSEEKIQSAQELKSEEKLWQDSIGNELIEKSYQCPGTRLVYEKQFDRIIGTLKANRGCAILEVGCGRGQLLNAISEILGDRPLNLYGLDLSSKLNELNERYRKNIHWITADGEDLPFSDQRFDVVIYNGSLHHMPDYERALKEAFRVIKEDGQVVLYEPESTLFSRSIHRLLDPLVFRKVTYESPIDRTCKNDFRFSDLQRIINDAGFTFTMSRHDFLAYPLTGCYSNSVFSRKPALMNFLIYLEDNLESIPGLRKLFQFFCWRLLMDISKSPKIKKR
jgi:ubiquinone/menaquinone biosynthesis C-methylase UbiE